MSPASLFHNLRLNLRIKLEGRRSMVLTLAGNKVPIAHTRPCSQLAPERGKPEGPHVLEGGKENGIFLKPGHLLQAFLKKHVSM